MSSDENGPKSVESDLLAHSSQPVGDLLGHTGIRAAHTRAEDRLTEQRTGGEVLADHDLGGPPAPEIEGLGEHDARAAVEQAIGLSASTTEAWTRSRRVSGNIPSSVSWKRVGRCPSTQVILRMPSSPPHDPASTRCHGRDSVTRAPSGSGATAYSR